MFAVKFANIQVHRPKKLKLHIFPMSGIRQIIIVQGNKLNTHSHLLYEEIGMERAMIILRTKALGGASGSKVNMVRSTLFLHETDFSHRSTKNYSRTHTGTKQKANATDDLSKTTAGTWTYTISGTKP